MPRYPKDGDSTRLIAKQLKLLAGHARRRRPIKSAPSSEEEWRRFESRLACAIADLEEDEYLILSDKRTNYYVQFAAQGAFGMRIETVSNAFIEPGKRLSRMARARLLAMGWNPPTYEVRKGKGGPEPADGSPNYYIDAAAPVPYRTVASLAVDTLRQALRVRHCGELQYKAFSRDGASIRFPLLRIKREPG